MIRNIDVLKKIKDKANKFLIISDGVDVTLDIEDANLTELVSEEDEEVLEMLESAESIEILIMQLTEDLGMHSIMMDLTAKAIRGVCQRYGTTQ